MNQLSWMLYAASVSDNISWLIRIVSLLSVLGALIWLIAGITLADERGTEPKHWRSWRRIGFGILLPSFLLSVVIGSFVPDKNTIYAIAAFQRGEQALQTPEVGKSRQALSAWLDKQIKVNTQQ